MPVFRNHEEPSLGYYRFVIKHYQRPFWSEFRTFVAEENDEILGTYYMKTNQAAGGSHVCNCGYITSENARGRGIARQMCEHSLLKAPELGFQAMQY